MYAVFNTLIIIIAVAVSPLIGLILLVRRKYRSGFFQKCGFYPRGLFPSPPPVRPVWVHAVSVGEVMASVPFIREIQTTLPDQPLYVSTVTETGFQTATANLKHVDAIFYFPFDFPFIVRKAVSRINPKLFIALETEIWPNLLRELGKRNIPSLIISGRISSVSFKRYYFFRWFFKRVLENVSCFCMQTENDAARITRMGALPERVTVSGNIKFDQQIPAITREQKSRLYTELNISTRQKVFIAGSTHKGEEETVAAVYGMLREIFPDLVLIIAPRHPERFAEVETLLKSRGIDFIKKTGLAGTGTVPGVVLLDTIGELSKLYSISTIVFVGGSLVPVGGHNVLEPAVFAKPVIFGPHMDNFEEISRILLAGKAAFQVSDTQDFFEKALRLLQDDALREQTGQNAFNVITENSGAIKKSMAAMERFLSNTHPS